jgi:phosphoribosylglycinamide formyltransferase-1
MTRLPVVILISGRGSNLRAIIDQAQSGELPIEIRAVISNRPEAPGLQLAADAGIEARALDHKSFPDRESFDAELQTLIDSFSPELVVLAGYMRILTPSLVRHYQGRMLNIHPSLLPKYQGLNTHQRALEAGDAEHGASIHFVTEELDGGPVFLQAPVPVLTDDTPETLAARVLEQEHRLYPEAIRWFAQGRVRLEDDQLFLDGQPLPKPVSI